MISMKSDSEIIGLVLVSFQKELAEYQPREPSRAKTSPPPWSVIGYAQRYLATDERGNMSGSVLGVWRITPDAIEKMPLDFEVPEPDPSQGSWSCTYFRFTLPDASGLGTSESVSGPLCGYGYHYRVGDDSVEIVKGLWIS